ncbi:mandelate racemase [Alphaproteobacteria bacterium HT1-32]|nr:mandelate racemase [Alphaproteobacteria bacterium HT1-32]
MRITRIVEKTAGIKSNIRNAVIDFSKITLSLVAVETDVIVDGKPVIGYGYTSNGRYAVGEVLRERIMPRLMEADPDSLLDADGYIDPHLLHDCLMKNEKVGGHGDRAHAVAAVDIAIWDAICKAREVPFYREVARRHNGGKALSLVNAYPGGGYYTEKGNAGLRDEMKGYLDQGYKLCKMKIGGASVAEDIERIEVAQAIVGEGNLAVDANAGLNRERVMAYAEALEPYKLAWFEEPCDSLDFELQTDLADRYPHPIATGENCFSRQDAKNLLRFGGLRPDRDVVQWDPSMAYGPTEFIRIVELSRPLGWKPESCSPHGGLLLGLGLAAGLELGGTENYPLVFQPYGGFSDDAVVENGMVAPCEAPGMGWETRSKLYNEVLKPLLD